MENFFHTVFRAKERFKENETRFFFFFFKRAYRSAKTRYIVLRIVLR